MDPDRQIRIVIAEDHRLFREGIRSILKDEKNIEIIGEAANGLQAIELVNDLKPDVILLDISMPVMDGIQIIPVIRQKSPGTKVLMLTASKDETTIFKSIRAGAKGYLSKDTDTSSLIKAIKVVHKDQLWIQRKLVARFFNGDYVGGLGKEDLQEKAKANLTPREQDVLLLLTKGYTNKEIANDLFISEKTVRNHLNKVFRKLNVNRRIEAILSAIKMGFT